MLKPAEHFGANDRAQEPRQKKGKTVRAGEPIATTSNRQNRKTGQIGQAFEHEVRVQAAGLEEPQHGAHSLLARKGAKRSRSKSPR